MKIQYLREHFGSKSFKAREAHKLGISHRMLSFYAQKRIIERVAHGLYVFPSQLEEMADEDGHYQSVLIAKSIEGAVICLISALSYWNITEEIEREFWIAIPNNYPIPSSFKNAHFIRPRDLKTGVVERLIAGEKVRITTPERSVCDAFKYLDEESAITSLRMYLGNDNSENRNVVELLDMAKKLKCHTIIKILQEQVEANAKDYPEITPQIFKEFINWHSIQSKEKK